MRIIKPHWCLHSDDKDRPGSIFSLSIHPDSSRVATGGLDTKLKIWATAPILDEKMEQATSVPRLLCTLTSHAGVVMCVRWSPTGRYLASGSDDKVVMISSLVGGAGGKVWGSTETNVENWKAVKRLVGHDSDVAGVAWSADEALLASVGLDSTTLVWSGENFQLLRKLDGHQGFVKGVVFDPVGQYLATQSDDNTVKIWRTTDWQIEANISAPFVGSPKTSITRLSWSPEGTHIVTPNSMNGPVFVAAVIDRKTWKSNNSLVGHENIVEVTAFSPLIFLRDPKGPPTGVNLCAMLALSARNSISFWVTSQSQPFLVLDEVFDRDVLDLSWSSDGLQLWACSSEGHVTTFIFDPSELPPLAPPGTREAYHRTYNFVPRLQVGRPLSNQSSASSLAPVGTMAQPNLLVSRKGPGAKRKIVPTVVQPVLQQYQQPVQQFQPPIQQFAPPPQMQFAQQQQQAYASTSAAAGWGPAPETSKKRRAEFEEEEEETLGGHSRVSQAGYRTKGRTLGEERSRDERERRELRPAYVAREREVTFEITNRENQEDGVRVLAVPAVTTFGTLGVEEGDDKDTLEWRNFAEGDAEGTAEVAVVTKNKTLWVDYLPKWVVCAAGSPRFTAVSTDDGALVAYSPTGRRLLPTIILDSPCSFLEAEGPFLMAVTSLGTLHVWNTSIPKSHFAPLPLSALLTSSATLTTPHPTITTSALLPNGTPLIALSSGSTYAYDLDLLAWTRLSEPFWSKKSDFWEGRRGKAGTSGRGVIRGIESAINDICVDAMEVEVDEDDEEEKKIVGEPQESVGDAGMERSAVSLAHLEVRMKAAVRLDSPGEYKQFLTAYVKRLAEEGFRSKAEELVKELLGPVYFKPGKESEWSSTVVGLNKRDLLKEVLSTFAKSRMIASLGTEYQELLRKITAA